MPYVHRSANGEIDSLHRAPTLDAAEFVDSADMDLQRFVSDQVAPSAFGRLDADFVRVLEDVIDTLIVKNVINITDLPEQAQAKLFARKSFRERVTRHSLKLFGDSGFSEVIDDTNFGDLR